MKELLGLWIEASAGASFWPRILDELEKRGLKDILIVCCDGLKGLPQAVVQTCIVHQVRYCLFIGRLHIVANMRTTNATLIAPFPTQKSD